MDNKLLGVLFALHLYLQVGPFLIFLGRWLSVLLIVSISLLFLLSTFLACSFLYFLPSVFFGGVVFFFLFFS